MCDSAGTGSTGVQYLEYHVHNKYIPPRNYDPQELFNIIEEMLTPQSMEQYDQVCTGDQGPFVMYWGPRPLGMY